MKSLRGKLTVWFTALLVIVFGTFSLYLYYSRRTAIFEKVDADLRLTALNIAGNIKKEEGRLFPLAPEVLESIDPAITLRIYDSGGQEIYRWSESPKSSLPNSKTIVKRSVPGKPLPSTVDFNLISLFFSGRSSLPAAHHYLLETGKPKGEHSRRLLIYAAAISQEEDEENEGKSTPAPAQIFYIVCLKSTEAAEEELEALARLLFGSGLLIVALAAGGGFFLSGRALRPVRKITETLENISASNLRARIPSELYDRELLPLVNQLNAALERLEQAFERERRFTADASHELRTPLSVIINTLEVLIRRPRSVQEYHEAIKIVLKASSSMQIVLEDLLTLARLEAGKLSLQLKSSSLYNVANEAWDLLTPEARKHHIHFYNEIPPQLVASVDSDKMKRVFLNLLKNAISYNRPEGEIRTTAAIEADGIILEIADTGIGIPAEQLPHIFERFFRVDSSRSDQSGGAGLGLAIVKTIIELHGGKISVTSQPGKTVFRLILPLI
jgi:heavy metal sensor kinase